MKIYNLKECTTAGSVAPVAQPFKAVQTRIAAPKEKGSNLLKGIKTSKKFANSISESAQKCSECGCAVCECMMTESESTPNTDQILYALTDAARHITNSDAYGSEGKNTISTLYRLMRDPLKAGDLAGFEKAYDYCLGKYPDEASELIDTMYQSAKLGDQGTYEEFMSKMHEGAKVDRMVGHVKSSEKKLGKSSKEAENIAWATANKRGMLNKNKKQGMNESPFQVGPSTIFRIIKEKHPDWIEKYGIESVEYVVMHDVSFRGLSIPASLEKVHNVLHALRNKGLNELSSNTLGKYKKAASETLPKNMHQAGNRAQGVAKAKDKIHDKEVTDKAKAVGHPMVQEADEGNSKYDQGYSDGKNSKPNKQKEMQGNDKHNYKSGYEDGLADRKKSVGEATNTGKITHPSISLHHKKGGYIGTTKYSPTKEHAIAAAERTYRLQPGSVVAKFDKPSNEGVAEGNNDWSKPRDPNRITKKRSLDSGIIALKLNQGMSPEEISQHYGVDLAKVKQVELQLSKNKQTDRGVTEGSAPWAANWKKAALASKKAQQEPSGANHKRAAELHRHGASDPWGPYKDKHEEAATKHEKSMKMYEGRFVKGPGGVPLDRHGNKIVPKSVEAPSVLRVRRDSNGLSKEDYSKVWRKIEEVVGNIFPDGDPIDWLAPWLKKSGIEDYHIGEVLDKACRMNGYKDMYAYYDHFKTGDYGYNDLAEGEITEDDVVLAPGKGRRLKPGLLHKTEVSINPTDTVKVDVPLLIRLLEFAREDAKTDMDLHDLAEKLIAYGARGRTLTMKDYESLVPSNETGARIGNQIQYSVQQ